MFIDVMKFLEELCNELTDGDYCQELTLNSTRAKQDAIYWFKKKKKEPELVNMMVARSTLGHYYGELIAIRFKNWIDRNYQIGQADGVWNPSTDFVCREPEVMEAA